MLEYLIEKKHNVHIIIPKQIYNIFLRKRINISHFCFERRMPTIKSLKNDLLKILKILVTLKFRFIIKNLVGSFITDLKHKISIQLILFNIKLKTIFQPVNILLLDDKSFHFFNEINILFSKSLKYYISYEIWFKNETPDRDLPYFYSLKKYIHEFRSIIIQDKARESILRKEKDISEENIKFKFLPVAYENLRFPVKKKSARKILVSGSLDRYTGVDQIIKLNETETTLANFEFTFQTHRIETTNTDIIKIIKDSSKSNILLDDRNFSSYKNYFEYISLYDVGISIYIPHLHSDCSAELGKNIEEIGLSSGKMNAYLANSLPVVATKTKYLNELNNKYNFGILIDNISELPKALDELSFNYSEYSQNAFEFYNKVLRPSNYLSGIFKN